MERPSLERLATQIDAERFTLVQSYNGLVVEKEIAEKRLQEMRAQIDRHLGAMETYTKLWETIHKIIESEKQEGNLDELRQKMRAEKQKEEGAPA